MFQKQKFLDPIIVVGVVISIAVAIILILLKQDQAISLLIGLVITIITLIVDLIARVKESEKRVIEANYIWWFTYKRS